MLGVRLVALVLFNSVEQCLVNLWFVLPLLGCFGLLVGRVVAAGWVWWFDCLCVGWFVGLDCRHCSGFAGCFDFSYFVYCCVGLGGLV